MEHALQPQEQLLNADEVAAALGISWQTLANWRSTKRYQLPYIKVGQRVRYKRADVDAFIASRRVAS